MNNDVLKKAYRAITNAENSIKSLELAETAHEFHIGWYNFLTAAANIYTVLESGFTGKLEKPWFGQKKAFRKKDGLLNYLHHARNAEEHTGVSTIHFVPKRFDMKMPTQGQPFQKFGPGQIEMITRIKQVGLDTSQEVVSFSSTYASEEESPLQWYPLMVWLNKAVDRGVTYDPPAEHQGKQLEDKSPVGIAQLCLAYLRDLLHEANELFGEGLHLKR
jgi:hypothetical protein